MWRGPDNQIHFLGAFGGDAQLGWFGHYINMNTGAHKLITGPPKGEARHWAYNPAVDRAYTHSGYANPHESFCEFNPNDQTLTIIKNELTTCLNLLIGDDNRVYTATLGNRLYSYDPTLGNPTGWKGISTAGSRCMWKDGSNVVHIFAAFGGDGSQNYYGHYVNTTTDAHAMITGVYGDARIYAYNQSVNKLYICGKYHSILAEFNPSTKALTTIKDNELEAPLIWFWATTIGFIGLRPIIGYGLMTHLWDCRPA